MKEVRTKVNSSLTLECECWAVPPPSISWYKDGRVRAGPQTALDTHLRVSLALPGSLQKEALKVPSPRAGPAYPSVFNYNRTNTFHPLSPSVHSFASYLLLRTFRLGLTESWTILSLYITV